MYLGAFCVLGVLLMVSETAYAGGVRELSPIPPKPKSMSQDEYAKSVFTSRRKPFEKIHPDELPKPDSDMPKYVITDDPDTIKALLAKNKFVEKFKETPVRKVEQSTAYKLTAQNFWNNKLQCIQRIRVYEEVEKLEEWLPKVEEARSKFQEEQMQLPEEQRSKNKFTPPEREFETVPREDLLARCEGGYALTMRTSKYRFGFADAIHFYGKNRVIYKIQAPGGKYFCHERMYTVAGRQDKFRPAKKCDMIINRIYSFQGSIKNLLFNLDPTSMISGGGPMFLKR